ncbi:DUF359 domain-containing protein [Halobacteriales archaeon QS_1_67_19]|nr:MAG: DUF359 domain-containing protein [Halobacteriales archaeon QS_1_67_19]
MGPIFTDAQRLLSEVEGPLVAVGDVVTAHLAAAGAIPDVAVVDGLTKRETVTESVAEEVATVEAAARELAVENPAATLSGELAVALGEALADPDPTLLVVDGEEDLAALPAIVAAPLGASVVYGQPDEGMVHVPVTGDAKAAARALLDRMDGDVERLYELLDAA